MNRVFLILLALLFSAGCFSQEKQEKVAIKDKINFEEMIARSESQIIDLTAPGDLFKVQMFRSVYNGPEMYLRDIISFINSENHTAQQKEIAIYSMSLLPLDHYLVLTDTCLKLFKSKSIDEELLVQLVMDLLNRGRLL